MSDCSRTERAGGNAPGPLSSRLWWSYGEHADARPMALVGLRLLPYEDAEGMRVIRGSSPELQIAVIHPFFRRGQSILQLAWFGRRAGWQLLGHLVAKVCYDIMQEFPDHRH